MTPTNRKILIADDLSSIHDDFRKILQPRQSTVPPIPGLASFAPHLVSDALPLVSYDLGYAFQGEEVVRLVSDAKRTGEPYSTVFLDVRMPPGIDGVETAERLIKVDPELQIVLCTAYADYSFGEISRRFRDSPNFLILKKPFDPAEILQVAHTLCQKWTLAHENARLIRDLEERVKDRTRELEKAKGELEVALRKAQAADRSKAGFLSCVSHELYTPLNGIVMSAELLVMSKDPESQDYGVIIRQSCGRLQRLFGRILTFVELDEAPPAHSSQSVDVGSMLNVCAEEYAPTAKTKGLALTFHYDLPPTLLLGGDEGKLALLVDAVVDNAVKFTEQGSVKVNAAVKAGGEFEVRVEDTGPGLSDEQVQRINRLFEPGNLEFNRKHEGIGLGLSLGTRIAEYFGGKLDYKPREGGGSVFTLSLPVRK